MNRCSCRSIGRSSLVGLVLEGPQLRQVALALDDALDLRCTEGADQLVLEVVHAHVEADLLHLRAGEIRSESGPLQAATNEPLLAGVAQPCQTETVLGCTQDPQVSRDVGGPTGRHDDDPLCRQGLPAPRGQGLDGRLVADALDQHDRPDVDARPRARRGSRRVTSFDWVGRGEGDGPAHERAAELADPDLHLSTAGLCALGEVRQPAGAMAGRRRSGAVVGHSDLDLGAHGDVDCRGRTPRRGGRRWTGSRARPPRCPTASSSGTAVERSGGVQPWQEAERLARDGHLAVHVASKVARPDRSCRWKIALRTSLIVPSRSSTTCSSRSRTAVSRRRATPSARSARPRTGAG